MSSNVVMCLTLSPSRPNTGVSGFEEEKTDLLHKYMPISREKAGRSPTWATGPLSSKTVTF